MRIVVCRGVSVHHRRLLSCRLLLLYKQSLLFSPRSLIGARFWNSCSYSSCGRYGGNESTKVVLRCHVVSEVPQQATGLAFGVIVSFAHLELLSVSSDALSDCNVIIRLISDLIR